MIKNLKGDLSIHTLRLAEERTLLAFIRTVAIFCGLYVLLRKNVDLKLGNLILFLLGLVLMYRVIYNNNATNKIYIKILGTLLFICILILVLYA